MTNDVNLDTSTETEIQPKLPMTPSAMTFEDIEKQIIEEGNKSLEEKLKEQGDPAGGDAEEEPKEDNDPDEDQDGGDTEEKKPDEIQAKDQDQKKQQRSKYIKRERFDEVNTQKNDYKKSSEQYLKDLESERRALEQERDKSNKLAEFIKSHLSAKTSNEDDEDETPVDEKAFKKVYGAIEEINSKLEQNTFQTTLAQADQLGRDKLPDYDDAVKHVLFSEFIDVKESINAAGKSLSDEKAMEIALKGLNSRLSALHKSGADSAKIAAYVYKKATTLGFTPKPNGNGKSSSNGQDKSKIDMKAVDRARKEAGAPAIEKESVKVTNASNWRDDLSAKAKSDFAPKDMNYLKQWGI